MERELKDMLTLIYEEIKELKVRVTNLETSAATMGEQITCLQADFGDLNQKFDDLDQKFNDLDQKFDDLDQKFGDLDQKFGDLDQKFDNLNQKTDVLDRNLYTLQERVTALEKQVDQNFKILENDLGSAMDWAKHLQSRKVDKEALKQAAI